MPPNLPNGLPVLRCSPLHTNGSNAFSATARLLNCVTRCFTCQGVPGFARSINSSSTSIGDLALIDFTIGSRRRFSLSEPACSPADRRGQGPSQLVSIDPTPGRGTAQRADAGSPSRLSYGATESGCLVSCCRRGFARSPKPSSRGKGRGVRRYRQRYGPWRL